MSQSVAGREASRALHRAYWFYRAYRVEKALLDLRDAVERKYGYDRNQPRVPAGSPDGGQWTDGGGSGWSSDEGLVRVAQNDDPDKLTDVPPRPRNLPRSIQSLSDIPKEKPSSTQIANAVVKFVAYEFADYIMKQSERSVGTKILLGRALRRFVTGAEIVLWIRDEGQPVIESYSDPPRSLTELQDDTTTRRPGYEVHHIVEQNAAQPGEEARIKSRENLVSVPTFKHHLITSWYMRKNDKFDGLSPRDFLQDKEWEVRNSVGLGALVRFGVLKP